MLRIALLLAVLYFGQSTFASARIDETAKPASGDDPEKVIARGSLATHLGLGPQDVVFASPRNFRSEQMNQLSLEPIQPAEGEELGN